MRTTTEVLAEIKKLYEELGRLTAETHLGSKDDSTTEVRAAIRQVMPEPPRPGTKPTRKRT